MGAVTYTVICKIDFETMEQEWLDWLQGNNEGGGHIDEVIACGAQSAEIIKRDKDDPATPGTTYEIRYRFENRAALDDYLEKHAQRLREEGLEKFPVADGFHYRRVIGEML